MHTCAYITTFLQNEGAQVLSINLRLSIRHPNNRLLCPVLFACMPACPGCSQPPLFVTWMHPCTFVRLHTSWIWYCLGQKYQHDGQKGEDRVGTLSTMRKTVTADGEREGVHRSLMSGAHFSNLKPFQKQGKQDESIKTQITCSHLIVIVNMASISYCYKLMQHQVGGKLLPSILLCCSYHTAEDPASYIFYILATLLLQDV